MIPYLSLFLITTTLHLFYNYMNNNLKKITLVSLFFFFLLILGLRFEVGGDWFNFLTNYEQLDSGIWTENIYFQSSEPFYDVILKISRTLNLSLLGLNVILSFILLSSIFFVSLQYKNPLLTIIISVPYILIVFGMGYINQSTSFALVILGIYFFIKKKQFISFIFFLIAIGFHYSAFVFLPLFFVYYFIISQKISLNLKLVVLSIFIILFSISYMYLHIRYFTYLNYDIFGIYKYYLNPRIYTSPGAYLRLIINGIVFFLLFLFLKKLNLNNEEKITYLYVFFIFIFCSILLFFGGSTGADRLNLYVLLIQIFILPKIIELKILHNSKKLFSSIVIVVHGFMLIFWLEFANHKNAWVPYQMYFFQKYDIYFRTFP